MSASRQSTRSSRSQVLVVANETDFTRYCDGLSTAAIGVSSMFEALGEVTTAHATKPISTVVISLSALPNGIAYAPEAFRRVDPALKIVVIAQSKGQLRELNINVKDFDAVLIEPVTSDDLQRALSDEIQPFDDPPRESKKQVEPVVTEQEPSELTNADLLTAIGEKQKGTQTQATTTESLGDIDLVEAIQSESCGVLETALALMRQQTKWDDVRLDDSCAGDGSASAEVEHNDESFGWLCSKKADAQALTPWADWLARWLSLDKRYRDFRLQSLRDDLTGAWNRRFFDRFMEDILTEASTKRCAISLMVFDIDNFKQYNDQYGHAAGDEILRETVRLLKSMIRSGDRVCRLGGDEFAVIFADLAGPREAGSTPPDTVEKIANRFQQQICKMNYPKLGIDAPGTLSISGGLATYPWDGSTVAVLLEHADKLALLSKKKGKNVLTFGPGARQVCQLMDDSD